MNKKLKMLMKKRILPVKVKGTLLLEKYLPLFNMFPCVVNQNLRSALTLVSLSLIVSVQDWLEQLHTTGLR